MRLIDLIVVILFLALMAVMGLFFARRNKDTEAYFLGNRAFPGWAIGLSMLGTSISSITFLALPAAAFVLDWRQLVPNLTMPVVAVLSAIFLIPFFRRITATSAFEFLEKRYGVGVRLYAAFSFLVAQQMRLAVVLYLVSIPLAELLHVNLFVVILGVGIITGFYTVAGGIEAVVWTDVVQTIVLLGGGIFCLFLICHSLPGGIAQVIEVGMAHQKFSLGPVEWGLSNRSLLVMILLGIVNFGTEYSSNQAVIQRYIAAKSTREARKATLMCAFMSIPTWTCFFFVGTCLFVYYQVIPDAAVAKMGADEVLPHFILQRMPPGISGLIIAACLAAAMSTLSSVINAVSTISTVDFLQRFRPDLAGAIQLRWAQIFSLLSTILMIGGAIGIHYIPKESVNDMSLIISSLFGGGMFALYMIGFFSIRVGNRAILIGLITGIAFNLYMMCNSFHWLPACLQLPIHSYWTGILVNILLFAAALLASIRFPNRKSLENITFRS